MRARLRIATLLALGLGLPDVARAHHSTEGLFDRSQTVEFVGILQKLDMINPHVWFHFEEVKPDGQVKAWRVESDGPNQIRRALIDQLGAIREFDMGRTYIVRVEPGRASEADGYLKSMVFADGREFHCCGG